MVESALEIESGIELERFDLGDIVYQGLRYPVLTGFEGTGRCWWCGADLQGRQRKYCRGHGVAYADYFLWPTARAWCCKRQQGLCANCGKLGDSTFRGDVYILGLEVHHIVPLNGGRRDWSAFNLPWNLIGFCHDCHQEIHAVMRPPRQPKTVIDLWKLARQQGQGIFALELAQNTNPEGE